MRYRLMLVLPILISISCRSKIEKESMARGKEVYITNCISCHRENGEGVPGVYPSLVKRDNGMEVQVERAITLIQYGSGFEGGMNPVSLTQNEMVDVIYYIQNSWGNKAPLLSNAQHKITKNP